MFNNKPQKLDMCVLTNELKLLILESVLKSGSTQAFNNNKPVKLDMCLCSLSSFPAYYE
jgi:hypothetical protein